MLYIYVCIYMGPFGDKSSAVPEYIYLVRGRAFYLKLALFIPSERGHHAETAFQEIGSANFRCHC